MFFACGFCHRADGLGEPESASLAGLPAEYIVRQVTMGFPLRVLAGKSRHRPDAKRAETHRQTYRG